MITVGVFCGGFSGERSISLRSGKNVAEALRRKGYNVVEIDPAVTPISQWKIDVAFLALHGPMGEDGGIQAVLDHLNIPYTGSGVSASVLGMNKILTKWVLEAHGIPTAEYQVISNDLPLDLRLNVPVVIKPISEGSSLGVEIVETVVHYEVAARRLISQFGVCLVEEFILGDEITASVIEIDTGPIALPILGLRPLNKFYDFEAKYTAGKTQFDLPAAIPAEATQAAMDIAVAAHTVLGCLGASRTDMIVHKTRGPVVLEINTIPGMTDTSDLPAQAQCAGIPFDDLVERLLRCALAKSTA